MTSENNVDAKAFVSSLFAQWEVGDLSPFFAAISDSVHWTAIGNTPISGTYTSKAEYIEKCYKPIMGRFAGPVKCTVRQIIGEGSAVVVRWAGRTPTVSGGSYDQEYCWVIRVEGNRIIEVNGYFDTAAVAELFAT